MQTESYKSRSFKIEDSDARLRKGSTLQDFVLDAAGAIRIIPQGREIKVKEITTVPTGAKSVNVYVLALDASNGEELGWTSATNLAGKFYSETIGLIKAPSGGNKFGPHAAWKDGAYIGQIDLVRIVGTNYEVEHIAADSCDEFVALTTAARQDGASIRLNSGFRSYPEQKYLYDGRKKGLPGFNPANPPGSSNHQNGVAFDLDVKPGEGNPNYEWLKKNATRFGFVRTVRTEAWHWEYLPQKAAKARTNGKSTTW